MFLSFCIYLVNFSFIRTSSDSTPHYWCIRDPFLEQRQCNFTKLWHIGLFKDKVIIWNSLYLNIGWLVTLSLLNGFRTMFLAINCINLKIFLQKSFQKLKKGERGGWERKDNFFFPSRWLIHYLSLSQSKKCGQQQLNYKILRLRNIKKKKKISLGRKYMIVLVDVVTTKYDTGQ